MREKYRLIFAQENGDTRQDFIDYMHGKIIMSRWLNSYTYEFVTMDIDIVMAQFPWLVIELEKVY